MTQLELVLNAEQLQAVEYAKQNKSFILTGPAGSGKTTTQRACILELIKADKIKFSTIVHKHLPVYCAGFLGLAFTNVAVSNLKKVLPPELQPNCITVHAALEFSPVAVEDIGPDGQPITKKLFLPLRDKHNPLPAFINTFIIDEGGSLGHGLFKLLLDAVHPSVTPTIIFVGDINQLPPIYDDPTLLHALLSPIPRVELTQIYRQALDSKIIALAHIILSGTPHAVKEIEAKLKESTKSTVTIRPWKKSLTQYQAAGQVKQLFNNLYDAKLYDPFTDVILCPYKVELGVIAMNKNIATHMSIVNNPQHLPVFEVIAGFNKHYFKVGDKVFFNRAYGYIKEITRNYTYLGKPFKEESPYMDYWGNIREHSDSETFANIDDQFTVPETIEDRVHKASHNITIEFLDGHTEVLSTALEVNNLFLAYATTVHKFQGSEAEKVFLVFHKSHNRMICRELLYTAVTRAKSDLTIICEPDTFERGIVSQRIKGRTLEEKINWFKSHRGLPGEA